MLQIFDGESRDVAGGRRPDVTRGCPRGIRAMAQRFDATAAASAAGRPPVTAGGGGYGRQSRPAAATAGCRDDGQTPGGTDRASARSRSLAARWTATSDIILPTKPRWTTTTTTTRQSSHVDDDFDGQRQV